MFNSEPKTKKIKMEESNNVSSYFLDRSPVKRLATSFLEFMSDPINLLPRPEFVDNFYIDVTTTFTILIQFLSFF